MFSPVLMAPSADVLHCSEAAGNTGKAIEVVQDGATGLQVVRVSGCLGEPEDKSVVITEDMTTTMKKKAPVKSCQAQDLTSIPTTND